ncbi:MAG: TrbI F-type domain-containing protein [Alphaproteobacteria bacterium]|jgi:conjugal transfer pilin signal peptidase TrbI|nr:type-F conjugative transfer system protein TrbI [Candidatus Jidaibacter sp.]
MQRGQLIYNILVGVGLVLSTSLNVLNHKPQKVVTVDLEHLVRSVTQNLAKQEIPTEGMDALVKQTFNDLDKRINTHAKEEGAVVLVSKAVLAGATDITEELEKALGGE